MSEFDIFDPSEDGHSDHELQHMVTVWLIAEVERGEWEIDQRMLAATMLPSINGQGPECPEGDGCKICRSAAGQRDWERMRAVARPDAEQLMRKLAAALGYEIVPTPHEGRV